MTEPGNATWLLKRIDDLLGVGKAFVETPSDATREAFFAEMITVASGELLQGLVSEAQGGRLANATRLARTCLSTKSISFTRSTTSNHECANE